MQETRAQLLLDPKNCQDPLEISDQDSEQLKSQLFKMIEIRYIEEIIADGMTSDVIKCPCHLGIGQEAVAVGVSSELRVTDRLFGAHRSHTHFIAQGGSSYSLFAEVLGKKTGCSKGMGGSMHLIDKSVGFYGSVPIVGGSVPIAVGAGLAAKKDGNSDLSVSYLGDGAMEEGAVQESLNLASVMKLPVLFVIENNLFSSHMHITLRQPSEFTARYADAHKITSEIVDGNDVAEMNRASKRATEHIRSGKGPYFIEAMTYRWRGHVGPREDTDVGVKRKGDLGEWKKRDPVKRLYLALEQDGKITNDVYSEQCNSIKQRLNAEWEKAMSDPYPEESFLLETVYGGER